MVEVNRLVIAARLEEVRDACDMVVEAAEAANLDERAVYHCQMAVDEALTNIIEHGYGYEEDGNQIEVACSIERDRFVITITDDSPAFDPLGHSAPDPAEPLDTRAGRVGDPLHPQADGQRRIPPGERAQPAYADQDAPHDGLDRHPPPVEVERRSPRALDNGAVVICRPGGWIATPARCLRRC